MGKYDTLKTAVETVIKTNGTGAITGAVLQAALLGVIQALGDGYQFKGVASTGTEPSVTDIPVFYIGGSGTYSYFDQPTVPVGSIVIFMYSGTSWSHTTLDIASWMTTYGYQFKGLVSETWQPIAASGVKSFVIGVPGFYTYLNSLLVPDGSLLISLFDGSDWTHNVIDIASWVKAANKMYTNTQAGSTAAKTINAEGYSLINGGSIKIKFNNKNTADNATLNINGTGAKPIIYNGAVTSASNTWAAGEVVELYYYSYNGGAFYARSLDYDAEPTAGSGKNLTSGAVKAALEAQKVTVSQNTSTGYVDVTIGDQTTQVVGTQRETALHNQLSQEIQDAVAEIEPIVIEGDVTNAPDEEDLTSVNQGGTDVLKFKDRTYAALSGNGMGYKILRKNKTFAEQVTEPNTIYVIRYDFILGEDVTIPANCVLEFDGGSLDGNSITGNNTRINADAVKIFGANIAVNGSFCCVGNVLWFGTLLSDWNVFPDIEHSIDTTNYLQKALDSGFSSLYFPKGKYYVTSTLTLNKPKYLKLEKGCDTRNSNYVSSASIIYTDQNITLLNIAINLYGRYKVNIEGGIFDVTAVDAAEVGYYTYGNIYSKSVIKVGQTNGLLWGSIFDCEIRGLSYNANSCGISFCEDLTGENDLVKVIGDIEGLMYGIRIFNQGVCTNLDWCGNISTVVAVSIENHEAGYANLRGIFQRPSALISVAPSSYNSDYCPIYVNTNDVKISCNLNDAVGAPGLYDYAINIGDDAERIYLYGNNQHLSNEKYIKGKLSALESSHFFDMQIDNDAQILNNLYMGEEIKVPDTLFEYDGGATYKEIYNTFINIEDEGDYLLNVGELIGTDVYTFHFRIIDIDGNLEHTPYMYGNAQRGIYTNLVHFVAGKYALQFWFPTNPIQGTTYGFKNVTLSKAQRYGDYNEYYKYLCDLRKRIPDKAFIGTSKQAPYNPSIGEMVFFTDKGKPYWWNGTAWVDATGTPV